MHIDRMQPVIECDILPNPLHGGVLLEQRVVGSQALYFCGVGFVLNGNDTQRTCGLDGQWSGSQPNCDPSGVITEFACVHERISMHLLYYRQLIDSRSCSYLTCKQYDTV